MFVLVEPKKLFSSYEALYPKGGSHRTVHKLTDIASLLGTKLGTILNCKRDPYVHCQGSMNKADTDNASHDFLNKALNLKH